MAEDLVTSVHAQRTRERRRVRPMGERGPVKKWRSLPPDRERQNEQLPPERTGESGTTDREVFQESFHGGAGNG